MLISQNIKENKMDNNKKNPNVFALYLIGGLLAAIGVIMSLVFFVSAAQSAGIYAEYEKVQGTISRVEFDTTDHGIEYGNIYAEYEVNGVEYNNVRIYSYPSPPVTGSIVTVYYDPLDPGKTLDFDPSESSQGRTLFFGITLAGLGAVLLIMGRVVSKSRTNEEQHARFKSYEEYDGEKTERAGTLFDKEVDFRETRLHDKDRGETLNERKARRQRKFFGWGEYDHY